MLTGCTTASDLSTSCLMSYFRHPTLSNRQLSRIFCTKSTCTRYPASPATSGCYTGSSVPQSIEQCLIGPVRLMLCQQDQSQISTISSVINQINMQHWSVVIVCWKHSCQSISMVKDTTTPTTDFIAYDDSR